MTLSRISSQRRILLWLTPVVLFTQVARSDDIVGVGLGSYTTRAPDGTQQPPERIFRTARVKGPMPTNDWWSALAWKPLSDMMYPHPLALRTVAALLARFLAAEVADKGQLVGDTYWLGKQLGKWASLIPIAEQAGDQAAASAFMDRTRNSLDNFGQVDRAVTADTPFYAVFKKAGRRTHVAYNFGDRPRLVTFSDGVTVTCPPHSYAQK